MLVAADPFLPHDSTRAYPRRAILLRVGRRGLPRLVEATMIPTALFFLFALTLGAAAAMVVVLCWTYGAVLRRVLRGRAVPPLIFLAAVALTVRTGVALVSGSTFAYFVQPVATTVVLAGVFLLSVAVGRPLVGRLADEFCPLGADVASRPEVVRLFAGLTVLWAGVHMLTAATTFTMLVTMPIPLFIVLKTITCLAITVAAIILTVSWSIRVACRENLVFVHA